MDTTFGNRNIFSKIIDYSGSSDLKVHKLTYLWVINNFSYCCSSFYSPTIDSCTYRYLKWQIYVKQSEDYLSIYVCFNKDTNENPIKAKYKISIINSKGEKTNCMEVKLSQNFQPNDTNGFDYYIRRNILLDAANGLVNEDKLKLFCEIDVVVKTEETSFPSNILQFDEPECRLIEDLGNLLNNDPFSDVSLVVGGRILPAHKCILAARSDVFAAMFNHQMEEEKLSRITIMDVELEVIKEMLCYIYTGKAPNLVQIAGPLLAAADKYALDKLKLMCEERLCIQLSCETAASTLVIALLHNAVQLKKQTINFINTYSAEVLKTEGWQSAITEHFDLIAREMPSTAKN